MAGKLTIQNAEIRTAAVEIKTLTVSGKQVTLAVFRQLQERPLIADDGTLNGEPWGIVNYHPDKCVAGTAHWHVVWQDGTDLCRSRVDARPSWPGTYPGDFGSEFLDSLLYDYLSGRGTKYFKGSPPLSEITHAVERDRDFILSDDLRLGFRPEIYVTNMAAKAIKAIENVFLQHDPPRKRETGLLGWEINGWEEAIESLASAMNELHDSVAAIGESTDNLFRDFCADLENEARRRSRHREVRERIATLPQLFIAV